MNARDPNLDRVELVATALGPLRDEVLERFQVIGKI
jgi:hypothetical protein